MDNSLDAVLQEDDVEVDQQAKLEFFQLRRARYCVPLRPPSKNVTARNSVPYEDLAFISRFGRIRRCSAFHDDDAHRRRGDFFVDRFGVQTRRAVVAVLEHGF